MRSAAPNSASVSPPDGTLGRSPLQRYGMAVLVTAVAALIRGLLHPYLGQSAVFALFYPAIVLAGWYGGLGPGLLTTGLSVAVTWYFFINPTLSLEVAGVNGVLQLLLFTLGGLFIILLNEAAHRARRRERDAALAIRLQGEELRRAESEARESEERFRIMADSAPVLVWMAGTDKLGDWFNRSWLEFTGRAMEEETGNGWTEGIHPDDFDRCLETYTTSFDARREISLEYRLRRHDGVYRWVLDHGVPRFAPDGAFQGYIGSCIDIDDRVQAERERAQLLVEAQRVSQEAEAASRSKDEFLATVSHELRTPLNAIMGWAQLLQVDQKDPERLTRGFETIIRNAKLQAQLIDDLLDVSRIVSGKMRLDVRTVDLVPVIDAAIESIRPAAEAKQIGLRRLLDPQIGPVAGDPERLQQVIWNLLSNAVKFTPKGGKVEVRLERVSSHVEVVVADTGIGIRPDFLPHVFDRFRQLDSSTTRKQGGLGLGLAIVRHLTELHGGTVWVRSPGEGQGTTFVVKLPLSVAHLDDSGWRRDHPRAAGSTETACGDDPTLDLRGIRVLVVDDEADARDTLRQILEHCNAEVATAPSAAEGLALLQRYRPHVLLSDIGMPGEDGYSLIRQVRALPAEQGGRTPAAALTAFARSEDRRRALLAGFQMHVAKPVEIHELAAVVANLARGMADPAASPPAPPASEGLSGAGPLSPPE